MATDSAFEEESIPQIQVNPLVPSGFVGYV